MGTLLELVKTTRDTQVLQKILEIVDGWLRVSWPRYTDQIPSVTEKCQVRVVPPPPRDYADLCGR